MHLPPYNEIESELFDDSQTVPSYYSVMKCTRFIVIHLRHMKSAKIQLTHNVCKLPEDNISIPLGDYVNHEQLDVRNVHVHRLDNSVTILVPIKKKRKGVKALGHRFRFSVL